MAVPLHMGWRHVLFANWPVSPALVAAHLPDSLDVDTFDGEAWLSVVPFTNVDVRPTWWPAGWGLPLPELNLRTYVTHDGIDGVYFFSLDAQGIVGVVGARLFHHLPYYYARIDLQVVEAGTKEEVPAIEAEAGAREEVPADGAAVRFESQRLHPGARPVHYRASYGPTGERFRAEPDSLDEFLTERYRYYTESQDGVLRYASIDHEPWPLYQATVEESENTLFAANGFVRPESEPVLRYSPGVDTRASSSRRA